MFFKNDLFQIKEDVHPSGRSYVTMRGGKAWEFHKWLSWWQEPGDPDPLGKDSLHDSGNDTENKCGMCSPWFQIAIFTAVLNVSQ